MRFSVKLLPTIAAVVMGTAMPALAADLPIYQPSPIEPVTVYKPWQGLNVGVLGTYGFGKVETDRTGRGGANGRHRRNGSYDIDGGMGGVLVGLHGQVNNWVMGGEFDASFGSISGSTRTKHRGDHVHRSKAEIDQFYTLRGRLGYAMDNVLLYGTGGIGVMHGRVKAGGNDWSASRKGYAYTPVVGGGLEYKFNDTTSVRAEYLYATSFKKNFRDGRRTGGVKTTFDGTHMVRIGLSYQIPAF